MHETISSGLTAVYKFVFPAAWLLFFGFIIVSSVLANDPRQWVFLGVLVLCTFFICWLCCPLKHVAIDGSDLVISNYRRTIRVPVSDIDDVTENVMINIHPVWIHFRKPTEFGPKIMFMPTVRMFALFSSHPVVANLKALARAGDSRQSPVLNR